MIIKITYYKKNYILNSLRKYLNCREQYHRKKRTPALPLTEERIKHCYPGETLSSICNGIPQDIDRTQSVCEPRLSINWKGDGSTTSSSESFLTPSTKTVIHAGIKNKNLDLKMRKQKNYRGHRIDNKVKVVRPQLIDTRNIYPAKVNSTEKTNVFSNIKKVKNAITIKLLERSDNEKKRIIIKNPKYVYSDIHLWDILKVLMILKYTK